MTRAPLASAVSVVGGAQLALWSMHATGAARGPSASLLALGVASLAVLVLAARGHEEGARLAVVLFATSAAATLARGDLADLELVLVATCVVGIGLATSSARRRPHLAPVPLAVCALVVAFSFLATFAIPNGHAPTMHGGMHGGGHAHAHPTS